MNAGERHMSAMSFGSYLETDSPLDHPIPGSPEVILFFDPPHGRVGLRGPDSAQALPADLENIGVRRMRINRRNWVEIAITDPDLFLDGYPLLCGVADRVQLDGQSMVRALEVTLRRLGHLIRGERRMPFEAEVGLFGELVILRALMQAAGVEPAVRSWRGGAREEHDFGLGACDVEVKTTSSESRSHWVTALDQLEPTGGRQLWLLSVQVTQAGDGGTSLPELIELLRSECRNVHEREQLDAGLRGAGWRERFRGATTNRWRLRSECRAFHVQERFPRLTRRLLSRLDVDVSKISEVRYHLDLNSIPADVSPSPLAQALEATREHA